MHLEALKIHSPIISVIHTGGGKGLKYDGSGYNGRVGKQNRDRPKKKKETNKTNIPSKTMKLLMPLTEADELKAQEGLIFGERQGI